MTEEQLRRPEGRKCEEKNCEGSEWVIQLSDKTGINMNDIQIKINHHFMRLWL